MDSLVKSGALPLSSMEGPLPCSLVTLSLPSINSPIVKSCSYLEATAGMATKQILEESMVLNKLDLQSIPIWDILLPLKQIHFTQLEF